jgi:hypothetical protein
VAAKAKPKKMSSKQMKKTKGGISIAMPTEIMNQRPNLGGGSVVVGSQPPAAPPRPNPASPAKAPTAQKY